MAKEGLRYLWGTLALCFAAVGIGYYWIALIFFVSASYIAFFFRNPKRVCAPSDHLVISPADGWVIYAEKDTESEFLNRECLKVSVFMSLFDVHINRFPISGIIKKVKYYKGAFRSAYAKGVSNQNERNMMWISQPHRDVVLVQVAGLVARRIVFDYKEGDAVNQGERLGLIQFGSRCDLFLPLGSELKVKVGDRVKAGLSIIAAHPS